MLKGRGYFFAYIMLNFKKVYNMKIISTIISIVFLCNTTLYSYPLSKDTLRVHSSFKSPEHKRRIYATLLTTNIRYADSEDAKGLLRTNNAEALLLSSGKYLVTKEIADNELKLIRAVTHEDIEALMQIIAEEDNSKYQAIKEYILIQRRALETYYNLFSQDNKPTFPADLLLNDIIAKAFELMFIIDEGMVSKEELSPEELAFIETIRPIIMVNKHNYFTGEFWDPRIRREKIRNALKRGFQFYEAKITEKATSNDRLSNVAHKIKAIIKEKYDEEFNENELENIYLPLVNKLMGLKRHKPNNRLVVAISGATGIGKTTFAYRLNLILLTILGERSAGILKADHFFYTSDQAKEHGISEEWFHGPETVNMKDMRTQIRNFLNGGEISEPIYVEKDGIRFSEERKPIQASDILIVEGVYVLFADDVEYKHKPEVKGEYVALLGDFDYRIFLDTEVTNLVHWIKQRSETKGRQGYKVKDRVIGYLNQQRTFWKNADVVISKKENHEMERLFFRTKLNCGLSVDRINRLGITSMRGKLAREILSDLRMIIESSFLEDEEMKKALLIVAGLNELIDGGRFGTIDGIANAEHDYLLGFVNEGGIGIAQEFLEKGHPLKEYVLGAVFELAYIYKFGDISRQSYGEEYERLFSKIFHRDYVIGEDALMTFVSDKTTPDISRADTFASDDVKMIASLEGVDLPNLIKSMRDSILSNKPGQEILIISPSMKAGGVSEIRNDLNRVLNSLDISSQWSATIRHENPEFFGVSGKIFGLLEGRQSGWTPEDRKRYENAMLSNFAKMDFTNIGYVFLDDPYTLGLIPLIKEKYPHIKVIWVINSDISEATLEGKEILRKYLKEADLVVYLMEKYIPPDLDLQIPSSALIYGINPVSYKSIDLSVEFKDSVLAKYSIDGKRPLILQIGRYAVSKDPLASIEAYRRLKENWQGDPQLIPQLVIAAIPVSGDWNIYRRLKEYVKYLEQNDPSIKAGDIHLLALDNQFVELTEEEGRALENIGFKLSELNANSINALEVNALQQTAALGIHPSNIEGFGLVITEALLKKKYVVATNVGGIPLQLGSTWLIELDMKDLVEVQDLYSRFLGDDVNFEDIKERLGNRKISDELFNKMQEFFSRSIEENEEGYKHITENYLILKYVIRNLLAIWVTQYPDIIEKEFGNEPFDINDVVPLYVKYLIDNLIDEIAVQEHDYSYRQNIQQTLGYFGKYFGSRAIPLLVDALNTDNDRLREHLVRALVFIGEDAIPESKEFLRGQNVFGRQGAIEALMKIGFSGNLEIQNILERFIFKYSGIEYSLIKDKFSKIGSDRIENLGKIALIVNSLSIYDNGPFIGASLLKNGIYPTDHLISLLRNNIKKNPQMKPEEVIYNRIRSYNREIDRIKVGYFDRTKPLHISLGYTMLLRQIEDIPQIRKTGISFDEYQKILTPLSKEERRFLIGNASSLESKNEAELMYLSYEALQLYEYIMRMQEKANKLKRPLVVVENLTVGEISLAPIEDKLKRAGIGIIKTRLSSSKVHHNPYFVEPELFTDEELKYFLEEEPIVVVIDGSNSLREEIIDKYGARGRKPHFPDAYLGYVNYFGVLSYFLNGRCQDVDELLLTKGHIDRVLQEAGTRRLIERMSKLFGQAVSNETELSYQIGFWYPGEKELDIRINRRVINKPPYLTADNIYGPAMIFIESGIEDVLMPPEVKTLTNGITHDPIYFDSMYAKRGVNSFLYSIEADEKGVHIKSRYEDNKRKCEQYVNRLEGGKPVFIVLGRPGSGKSSIGKLMEKRFGIPFVSLGQVVRDMLVKYPGIAKTSDNVYKSLHEYLKDKDLSNGLILDENPKDNEALEKFLEDNGLFISSIINVDVSEETAIARLASRARPHVSMLKDKPDEVLIETYKKDIEIQKKSEELKRRLETIKDRWLEDPLKYGSGAEFGMEKTEIIKETMRWLSDKIFPDGHILFCGYGSYCKHEMMADSDLDLMLIYDDGFYGSEEIRESIVKVRAVFAALDLEMDIDSFHSIPIGVLNQATVELSNRFINRINESEIICGDIELERGFLEYRKILRDEIKSRLLFYFLLEDESRYHTQLRKVSDISYGQYYFDIKYSEGGMRDLHMIYKAIDFYNMGHDNFEPEEILMLLANEGILTEDERRLLVEARQFYLKLRLASSFSISAHGGVIDMQNIFYVADALSMKESELMDKIEITSRRIASIREKIRRAYIEDYNDIRELIPLIDKYREGEKKLSFQLQHEDIKEFAIALYGTERQSLIILIQKITSKELTQQDWPFIDAIVRNASVTFEMLVPLKERIDENKALWTVVNDRLYQRFSDRIRQYYYDRRTRPAIEDYYQKDILVTVSNEGSIQECLDELDDKLIKVLIQQLKLIYREADKWDQLSQNNRLVRDCISYLIEKREEKAVPLLIRELENTENSYTFHHQIQRILGKIGIPAIQPLILALDNKEQRIQEMVCGALTLIGNKSIPYLEQALKSENRRVREGTIYSLVRLSFQGDSSIKDILAEFIFDLSGINAEDIVKVFTRLKKNPVKNIGEIAITINSFSGYRYGTKIAEILFKNGFYPTSFMVEGINQQIIRAMKEQEYILDQKEEDEIIETICEENIKRYISEIEKIRQGHWNVSNPLHVTLGYTMIQKDIEKLVTVGIDFTYQDYLYLLETSSADIERRAELGGARNLIEKQKAELEYLAYEAFKIKEFIIRIKRRADLLGLPLVVVENLTYGGIVGSVIEKDLVKMGIKIVKTRQGSEEMHLNPTAIQEDLFSEEDIQFIIQKRPIVVVLDGTTSLMGTIVDRGIRRTRLPHMPDAYQGYRNFFTAVNERLGNFDHLDRFPYLEKVLKNLRRESSFERLKAKLAQIELSDEGIDGYRMMFWQRGEERLVLRSERESIGLPQYCDSGANNITGPALLFIQSGIENRLMPDWLKEDNNNTEHHPVYFDLSLRELGMRTYYCHIGIDEMKGPYVKSSGNENAFFARDFLRKIELRRSLFTEFLTDNRQKWFRDWVSSLKSSFENMYHLYLELEQYATELGLTQDELWNVYIPLITYILTESEKRSERPFIISIGGSTGVGKAVYAKTLATLLKMITGDDRIRVVHIDEFYKKPNRAGLADRERLMREIMDISSESIVLAEGVFVLDPDEFPDLYGESHLKVFIDAPLPAIKDWKISRTIGHAEIEGRQKSLEDAEQEWKDLIETYVMEGKKQAQNADIIISKDSKHNIVSVVSTSKKQEESKKPAIIILGKPGAGKTSIGSAVAERLGYNVVSLGEILREKEDRDGSFKKKEMQLKYQESFDLLRETLARSQTGIVLDFPRFYDNQYDEIDQFLKDNGFDITCVLLLDVSDRVAIERLYSEERQRAVTHSGAKRRIENYKSKAESFKIHYETKGLLYRLNGEQKKEIVVEAALGAIELAAKSKRTRGVIRLSEEEMQSLRNQEIISRFLNTTIDGPLGDIHNKFRLEEKAIQAEYRRLKIEVSRLEEMLDQLVTERKEALLLATLDKLASLRQELQIVLKAKEKFIRLGFPSYHNHTNLNDDGVMSPEALVDHAVANGITVLYVTGHDSLDGSIRAMEYAEKTGHILEMRPAVEIDAPIKGARGIMHFVVVGPNDKRIVERMSEITQKIFSRMQGNFNWRFERVKELGGSDVFDRVYSYLLDDPEPQAKIIEIGMSLQKAGLISNGNDVEEIRKFLRICFGDVKLFVETNGKPRDVFFNKLDILGNWTDKISSWEKTASIRRRAMRQFFNLVYSDARAEKDSEESMIRASIMAKEFTELGCLVILAHPAFEVLVIKEIKIDDFKKVLSMKDGIVDKQYIQAVGAGWSEEDARFIVTLVNDITRRLNIEKDALPIVRNIPDFHGHEGQDIVLGILHESPMGDRRYWTWDPSVMPPDFDSYFRDGEYLIRNLRILAKKYIAGKRYLDAIKILNLALDTHPFDKECQRLIITAYIGLRNDTLLLQQTERYNRMSREILKSL